jgi:hypothetical protein
MLQGGQLAREACDVYGDNPIDDEDFKLTLDQVYGIGWDESYSADDVCWITPVHPEDFKYQDRMLAGGCGGARAALNAEASHKRLVMVPWQT